MRVLAFLDGTLAEPGATHIHVDDLGLLRGDGIFETILVADGTPRELRPHLDRLARSASMLDLPEPDDAAWEWAIQAVIDNWTGRSEFVVNLVCTRGVDGDPPARPTTYVLGIGIDEKVVRARTEGVAAVTLDRGIDPGLAHRAPWLLFGAKTLSYSLNMAAIREAVRRGTSDAVFTATDGSVLEGPSTSVIVARDRTLYTPPAAIGILPGTTQAAVFRGAERAGWVTKIEPIHVDDLCAADGVFLTSSVRKLTRVHTIDGEALPDSTAIHAELADAYESVYA